MVPITPNWAPLLIIGKGNIVTLRVFVELPLELKCVSWSGIIRPCIWCNSNLWATGTQQSRTLAIKTIQAYRYGKVNMWSYSKRLASKVANLFAKESEKRRQSASEKLEDNLRKHYSDTVSTSRTPPRRGHHGNTLSWFILIKLMFKLSTTGH